MSRRLFGRCEALTQQFFMCHSASSLLTISRNKDEDTFLQKVWYFLLRLGKYLFACILFLKTVVAREIHMVIWEIHMDFIANSWHEAGDSEAHSGLAALYMATPLFSSLI